MEIESKIYAAAINLEKLRKIKKNYIKNFALFYGYEKMKFSALFLRFFYAFYTPTYFFCALYRHVKRKKNYQSSLKEKLNIFFYID